MRLEDDFKAYGVAEGSTGGSRLAFGIGNTLWNKATKQMGGELWYMGW